MTNTTNDSTITLTNNGGTYTVEVEALLFATARVEAKGLDDIAVQRLAADACGYDSCGYDSWETAPFKTWSRLEVMIAWVESGNFSL